MSDIPEAIGEIAQGALSARAVEPAAGEGERHTHETACLNCGTMLLGSHCHACGQAAHVHRTLGAFFHDLLHGVVHFEGKLWRTLPLLAWQPGRLTREYIDGRRASYISPVALFLCVVFLTFALFSVISPPVTVNRAAPAAAQSELAAERDKVEQQIARLEARRDAARAAGEPVAGIEKELADLRTATTTIAAIEQRDLASAIKFGDGARDNPTVAAIVHAVNKVRANPALFAYKIQSTAYKFSWLLIPISVPFVWLLFPFSRRFHLYDHTVFVTYSIAFVTILLGLQSLGAVWNWNWLAILPGIYVPLHMYRHLRGTYGVTRFGAIWRTAALGLFACIALATFITLLVLMAVK